MFFWKTSTQSKLIFWGLLISLILATILIDEGLNQYQFYQQEETFTPLISDFITGNYHQASTDLAYKGREMIIIDVQKQTLDGLNLYLRDDVLAQSPKTLDTLVLIDWDLIKEGHYVDQKTQERTGDAYRAVGNVTLIDWKNRTIVQKKRFLGHDPSEVVQDHGGHSGGRPYNDIIEYLYQFLVDPATA